MTDALFARHADHYDFVIIGGGSAGCVLATRLSEDPNCAVLLLEAGRDVRDASELPAPMQGITANPGTFAPSDLWKYEVSLLANEPRMSIQNRGRALGGSSAINGSLFMRGIPEDYDSWGGPWSYEAALPYFRKCENDLDFHDDYHGADGMFDVARRRNQGVGQFQQNFYEAAVRLGVPEKPDLNYPFGEGIGYVPMMAKDNGRTCASIAYLSDCRDRKNLTIRTGAVARQLLFEDQRAVGVAVLENDQPQVYRGHEIIVSSGTFGSAQLLLRSGVGPASELADLGVRVVQDLPVGRGLSCHPSVVIRVPPNQDANDPLYPRIGLVGTSKSSADGERNDISLFPMVIDGYGTVLVTVRLPSSAGSVRLRPRDPELLDVRYEYLHPHDLERIRDGVRYGFEILGRSPGEEVTDAWIMNNLRTPEHACGTCRMGPEADERSVVDQRCRVIGLDGLRVIDLSIVPRSVRSGPYATVIMLAERASDLVREDVR